MGTGRTDKLEYSAGAVSKGFWFQGFKKYNTLLNEGLKDKEIKKMQEEENILLAPSASYGRRMINEISKRIRALPKEISSMFTDLSISDQKILNILGIMMTDRLFFEFLYEDYREGLLLGKEEFQDSQIRSYFNRKAEQSEKVAGFSEGGKNRLRRAYKTYMREASLIKDRDGKSYYNRIILDLQLEELMKEELLPYLKALTGGQD